MIILLSFKASETYAENEVVKRFKLALEGLGETVLIVDPEHKDISTGEYINTHSQNIKFAISLHISIAPLPNVINYLCVWDPFVWRNNYQDLANLLRYDDYLLIETPAIVEPMQSLLKNIIAAPCLHFNYLPPATSQAFCIAPKKIISRRLFYCGIGGEQIGHFKTRLRAILKNIDHSNILDLYGPEKIKAANGKMIAPWANYISYRGVIPFDGYSLINKMHAAGISLVISSNKHRKEGVPSARIFEACAAGNVIIADNNAYFKHWSNSIYTVDFSATSEQISKQLLDCVNSINSDPELAFTKAQQSQSIFSNKHSLEMYFKNILVTHDSRDEFRKNFTLAKQQQTEHKIIYAYLNLQKTVGFYNKVRYFADKYNLNFLYRLYNLKKRAVCYMRFSRSRKSEPPH